MIESHAKKVGAITDIVAVPTVSATGNITEINKAQIRRYAVATTEGLFFIGLKRGEKVVIEDYFEDDGKRAYRIRNGAESVI